MPDTTDRRALIAGLRDLADFLEANPAIETPSVHAISAGVLSSMEQLRQFAPDPANTPSMPASGPHSIHPQRWFGPIEFWGTAYKDDWRRHELETQLGPKPATPVSCVSHRFAKAAS